MDAGFWVTGSRQRSVNVVTCHANRLHAGWLAGWMAGWLAGWVDGWLSVCLDGWLGAGRGFFLLDLFVQFVFFWPVFVVVVVVVVVRLSSGMVVVAFKR